MKIKGHISKWGDRVGLGLFIDSQEWNIWHHEFVVGLALGPWDIGLTIILWDIKGVIERLQSQGMGEEAAWNFCHEVRKRLPDPYHGNIKREIEKALAEKK